MPQYLSDQEIADYGPEFVDVMRRVAADTAQPLNDEVNRLRAAMGHVQGEVGEAFLQRMNAGLTQRVGGNWQAINRDPAFVRWAQQIDPFSGRQRAELMQDAWNSGDVARTAAFFEAYRQGGGGSYSYSPHHLLPTGQPQTRREGATYTPQQISQFYREVTAGRWADREQQRIAIDHDIIRAQHEGRITDNAGRPISFIAK